jgi:hypothetical protein
MPLRTPTKKQYKDGRAHVIRLLLDDAEQSIAEGNGPEGFKFYQWARSLIMNGGPP